MYLKLIDEKGEKLNKFYDKPFYVYLSLSNMCNANCVFCDVRTNKEKKCSIDVKKLIDELASMGTQYIHFTGGGEPFVNDDIFTYLEYCTQKNIKIIIISNGLNLDEDKIKRMQAYNIHTIFFSLDSHLPEIHDHLRRVDGIWDKVTSNINLIKKYMPSVKIVLNHVLNRENIDDFDKFIKLKEKYNFDYINPIVIKDYDELFFTPDQIQKYNANLDYYYELSKSLGVDFLASNINFFKKGVSSFGDRYNNIDLKCVYPSFVAFIDAPTGYVYPCDCSIHRDRTIYKIGELKKQSFQEIWNGNKRRILKLKLLNSELDCKTKCDEANCEFNKYYFAMKGE